MNPAIEPEHRPALLRSARSRAPSSESSPPGGGRGRSVRRAGLPTLVDIEEIAEHLGVNVRHVRRLVAERRIPYFKWGHLLRFDPDEVRAWLAEAQVEPFFRHGARRQRARLRSVD
ncbi:MAG: helix-turn-helix domain-containing protein [Aeromicrobium sp.]